MPTLRWKRRAALAAVLLAGALNGGRAMADKTLFDFGKDFDVAKVHAWGAQASLSDSAAAAEAVPAEAAARPALLIKTFHTEAWPGVALKAPRGTWNLSPYEHVALAVRNTGSNPVSVSCRVDNDGADGVRSCNTAAITLAPGEGGTLTVPFQRHPAGPAGIKLFGMRGCPVPQDGLVGLIDPSRVTQIMVFVAQPSADHEFQVSYVRAGGRFVAPRDAAVDAAHFFPFIDTFGQYIHREWPGKTRSPADLAAARKAEEADLASHPGPADWDPYGGWQSGPALRATGRFRTEKHGGRWWLVDPEGRLFFSHGTDCVHYGAATPVDERDDWFQDFPGSRPEFREFAGNGRALLGHYKGREVRTFDFARANAKIKYGDAWRTATADLAHRRLRSWGMNTIGNWSDAAMAGLRRTPYVATVHFSSRPIQGSSGYWGRFKDPFDPEFAANLRQAVAGAVGPSARDPWCIGAFVDNEIAWGDDLSLALASLASPADQATKKAFLADLRTRYGPVEKLNAAWGTTHASWDALAASTALPDRAKAAGDLAAFETRIAEAYFKTCRQAVKDAAPDLLYLGCRFAWVNDRAAAAAVRFCDVVGYNLYRRSVTDFRLPAGTDAPVIIGEFHFGALDRGLFHPGLVPVADQAERADAYKAYVRGALENPLIVGTHWFQYMDEATTGRPLDEENYQIGLVDICDAPYPETIAAVREVGREMYRLRAGGRGH